MTSNIRRLMKYVELKSWEYISIIKIIIIETRYGITIQSFPNVCLLMIFIFWVFCFYLSFFGSYERLSSKVFTWCGEALKGRRYFFPTYSSINIDWFVKTRSWESLHHLLLSHLPTARLLPEIRWKRFSNERCSHSWCNLLKS